MPSINATFSYFLLAEDRFEEVAEDDRHLAVIAARVDQLHQEAAQQLLLAGQQAAGVLQQSLDRNVQMQTLARRLRQLDQLGPKACLGFMLTTAGERIYVGRAGLSDEYGNQLMIDWRAPAARPFFSATHAQPEGLALRRRYRWRAEKIVHFWDEVFDLDRLGHSSSLDEHSAFIASLGTERTGRMSDVLSTIQADQDAIIRSSSRGALVVDGGPGTGKTVVALHRAAFMLYSDARLQSQRGRVLVVSPHNSYSSYVADVLPNLGEDDVLVATLAQMVPFTADQTDEDEQLASIKGSATMVEAVRKAVSVFEQPPSASLGINTGWGQVDLTPGDWSAAQSMIDEHTPHNENRAPLKDALIELLIPRVTHNEQELTQVRSALDVNLELNAWLDEHWPIIEAQNLLRALYQTPQLLAYCARDLEPAQRDALLGASAGAGWTPADLPLLDAAQHVLGDPNSQWLHQRERAEHDRAAANVRDVVEDLISSADDLEDLSSQLRNPDLQDYLVSQLATSETTPDLLTGVFSHVIIDEAQDLSDAQWAMVLRRCPSGSLTIVGDRAQCVSGFLDSWPERLARAGISQVRVTSLNINYRTTSQVMEAAATVIRTALPDANIPTSLRTDGQPVRRARPEQLEQILGQWLAENPLGVAALIGYPYKLSKPRLSVLSPEKAKGLEFDLVVVYRPEDFGHGLPAAVRKYVAMTRATAELVILSDLGGQEI